MTSSKAAFAEIWDRFDQLAEMPEDERQQVFHSDGEEFLSALMNETLSDFGDPKLSSALEFSEFILVLRENYRQWNHQLMKVMVRLDDPTDQSAREALIEFAGTCHWKHLTEVALHYIESAPGNMIER